MISGHRTRACVALAAGLLLVVAGCTGGSGTVTSPSPSVTGSAASPGTGITGTAASPSSAVTNTAASPGSSVTGSTALPSGTPTAASSTVAGPSGSTPAPPPATTPTPVTADGMATGPGVTTSTITLGVLVAPQLDRGFSAGVALWQRMVNAGGGVCGRTVQLRVAGRDGVPAELGPAYQAIGREVLGLITLASGTDASTLAGLSGGDGIPTLTPAGTSDQIRSKGPVVIGPTADILAINALDYLVTQEHLVAGDTVGVLSDGSATAQDQLAGLAWQADRAGVQLRIWSTGEPADWQGIAAAVSLAGPADTAGLLTAGPPGLVVITTVEGFDLALVPPGDADRLLVVTPTPAFDSDHPAVIAVAGAFRRDGGTDPGPRLLAGYATGATWGRVLTAACADLALTRSGTEAAMASVGPAPVDSLLGPADPGLVVTKHLPATRLSAIAVADPAAPTGLRGLTWLQAAGDIAEYTPGG